MNYNLKTEITDIDGNSIKRTMGEDIVAVLLTPHQQDEASNKYRYFTLSMKLHGKIEVELDKEEIQFILEKLERVSPPLIYGRIREFLHAYDEAK